MEIEINGVRYIRRPQKEKPETRGVLLSMLVTYGIISMQGFKTRDMPPYNLLSEFEAIQNKKSILSRSQRDYVTRQFNKYYEKK